MSNSSAKLPLGRFRLSDQEKEAIYGKAALRLKDAKNNLNMIEVELKTIGENLEATGKSVRLLERFDFDKETLNSDLQRMWYLIPRYQDAIDETARAQSDMDQLG